MIFVGLYGIGKCLCMVTVMVKTKSTLKTICWTFPLLNFLNILWAEKVFGGCLEGMLRTLGLAMHVSHRCRRRNRTGRTWGSAPRSCCCRRSRWPLLVHFQLLQKNTIADSYTDPHTCKCMQLCYTITHTVHTAGLNNRDGSGPAWELSRCIFHHFPAKVFINL